MEGGRAIHLTAAAYSDIAGVLANQAENNTKQPLTGQVRRRLASFIPAITKATPPVREPAWISGQLRGARGGLRGGQRGGQWGGQGRSPWRGPRRFPF